MSGQQTSEVTAILLAAGQSSRMPGQNKLLMPISGVPILQLSYNNIIAAGCASVVLVVSDISIQAHLCLRADTRVILCETAESGMSESLKTGVACSESEAVLILLADQPRISSKTIKRFLRSFAAGNKLIAGQYEDHIGCPALFHRNYYEELQLLSGDKGARLVLENHRDMLRTVDIPGHESLDIDVKEDFEKLKEMIENNRV